VIRGGTDGLKPLECSPNRVEPLGTLKSLVCQHSESCSLSGSGPEKPAVVTR
jgi:hypothetical protein